MEQQKLRRHFFVFLQNQTQILVVLAVKILCSLNFSPNTNPQEISRKPLKN
jgi:hypothetical protein